MEVTIRWRRVNMSTCLRVRRRYFKLKENKFLGNRTKIVGLYCLGIVYYNLM